MLKIVKIFYILLLLVSCVFTVLFYAGGTEVDGLTPLFTSSFLVWGYILAALGAIASLIFPLFQMITSPGSAKKSFIGILALVAIVAISYLFSSGEAIAFTGAGMDKFNVPALLKRVDTGLFATYILMGIALLTLIYTEIANAFK